jgi:hypothetical protein
MKSALFSVFSILVLVTLACGFNVSTANIGEAILARDADAADPTTIFAQDETIYAVIELANAPDDTNIRAVWIAVEADNTDPDFLIDQVELTSGSGQINFSLTNDRLWPVGRYKVDLYLNDTFDRTLDFEVGDGLATTADSQPTVRPDPTARPEPTSTPTPTPEPTPSPEPSPTNTPRSSTGDTLSPDSTESETLGSDPVDANQTPQPLPLGSDPYIHPSGAFSFLVPQEWSQTEEEETFATFGSSAAIVGAEFFNADEVYDETLMQRFIELYLEGFVPVDEYEVILQEGQPDGSTYIAVTFQSDQGDDVDSDFFFEQHGTVVYVFYFSTFNYDDLAPTWNEIIASYALDPDAALAAVPVSTAAPTEPAPAANPFAPAPQGARVYLQNNYSSEYNIDFGDGSGSIAVLPGAENFYHDLPAGKYNPGLSLPAAGATNVQLEIAAGEAWLIVVTEDLSVNWGQVFP